MSEGIFINPSEISGLLDYGGLSERDRLKTELVDNFYKSEEYQDLKEGLGKDVKKIDSKRNGIIDPALRGKWEGMVFEEMALDYYYSHIKSDQENRALAEFLKHTLSVPNLREIGFYEGTETTSNLRLLPEGNMLGNSDALLVDVETDRATGKKVAKIVGILDAKVNGRMEFGQAQEIKKQLTRVVKALKPHFAETVRALDIDFALPEAIDIVPTQDLKVKVIRPQIENSNEYSKRLKSSADKIYVPINRSEIGNIVNAMVGDARNNRD